MPPWSLSRRRGPLTDAARPRVSPFGARPLVLGALLGFGLCASAGCSCGDRPAAQGSATPATAQDAAASTSAVVAARPDAAPAPPLHDDAACADCHPDEVDGFRATGMGRSLYRPSPERIIEDFTPAKATVVHPKTRVTYRAYIDPEGRWWQEESLPEAGFRRAVEVKYVIGSGNHTRSYIGEVEGELVELPLTWYVRRAIWDMSPGYDVKQHFRFERPIRPECIFCHNDLSMIREHTAAGYREPFAEGISCVRCHGDGGAHIAARTAGGGPKPGEADPTIINPARLEPLAQLRICQQCHLTGETRVLLDGHRWDRYDPRTPLSDYMSIYVYERDGGAEFGISSHGHRLSLSKCFTASGGRLSCSQCHNPHQPSDDRQQRAACLGCHQVEQCGDAHGAADGSCAKCHMHQGDTSDIPHVTFTDHFIRKQPGTDADDTHRPSTLALVDAVTEGRAHDPPERAAVRLAIAHAHLWRVGGKKQHHREALKHMAESLTAAPDRLDAWEELGHLFLGARDPDGAARAFAEIAKRDPSIVPYRLEYAQALETLGELDAAEKTLREAIRLRPDYRQAIVNLANVLLRFGRTAEADALYERADALAPHAAIIPHNRGHAALHRGDFDAAERFFREAMRRDATTGMVHLNFATLAIKRQRFAEAMPHLDAALARDPEFVMAYWMRAQLRIREQDLGGARADAIRMTQVAPENGEGYMLLAQIAFEAGDHSGASQALNRGMMMAPDHPGIHPAAERVSRGEPPIQITPGTSPAPGPRPPGPW